MGKRSGNGVSEALPKTAVQAPAPPAPRPATPPPVPAPPPEAPEEGDKVTVLLNKRLRALKKKKKLLQEKKTPLSSEQQTQVEVLEGLIQELDSLLLNCKELVAEERKAAAADASAAAAAAAAQATQAAVQAALAATRAQRPPAPVPAPKAAAGLSPSEVDALVSAHTEHTLHNLLSLLYYGQLFERRLMGAKMERDAALSWDAYSGGADALLESDLDLLCACSALLTSRPQGRAVSHETAIRACSTLGKALAGGPSKKQVPELNTTLERLHNRLQRIKDSDYAKQTPQMQGVSAEAARTREAEAAAVAAALRMHPTA